MHGLIEWLESTSLSHGIQNLLWIVPAVQTVHIVAVAVVLSSMLMIGLRLLDRAGTLLSVGQVVGRFLPWVWVSLAVLLVTGSVLIIGEPARTLGNPSFWVKMALLAVVLVAAIALQLSMHDGSRLLASHWRTSRSAYATVSLNLLLWCAVAVAGRWIAYTKV
jgi:uncharacterized membrane protein